MEKLFNLYKKMLLLHIGTKTNDLVFHQASENFYNTLFDVFHQISEKKQDIEEDEFIDCEEARAGAYLLLKEAKSIAETLIKSKTTVWIDNLLRGFVDKLEFDIGTARGLTMQYSEEEKEDTKETKIEEKKPTPFTK